MDTNKRFSLIKEVGQEIVTEEELKELLKSKSPPIAYDGFEPSGRVHIAQGLLRTININKMTKAGCKFKMLVADWFAFLNNKYGGDINKIKIAGEYFIEVWKACGLDENKVEFIWSSELIKDPKYWELVMKIATMNSVDRIKRCAQIMGRSEEESLSAAQIFYPCMQAADVFYLNIDITQLGTDQRKVNVLAREMAPKLGYKKPIIVSHHMLPGLGEPPIKTLVLVQGEPPMKYRGLEVNLDKIRIEGNTRSADIKINKNILLHCNEGKKIVLNVEDSKYEVYFAFVQSYHPAISFTISPLGAEKAIAMKMSKSNPDTAIFIDDSKEEVLRKIQKAYCPAKIIEDNPILEYAKHIIFELSKELTIERPEKFGGNLKIKSYNELESLFKDGKVHPLDLKKSIANEINKLLEPIRRHFSKGKAKALMERVKSFEVTR